MQWPFAHNTSDACNAILSILVIPQILDTGNSFLLICEEYYLGFAYSDCCYNFYKQYGFT